MFSMRHKSIEESTFIYILLACISMSVILIFEIFILNYPKVDLITWIAVIVFSSAAFYTYNKGMKKELVIKAYFSIMVFLLYPFAWFFSDKNSPTPLLYGVIILVSTAYLLSGTFRIIVLSWIIFVSTLMMSLGLTNPELFPTVEKSQMIKDTWIQIPVTFFVISLMLIMFSNNLREKNESLEEALLRDYLTGVYNRRYIYKYIDEINQTMKKDKKLLVGLIDVNNFKSINDTYGHLIGDAVLIGIANHIKKIFNYEAVVSRTGGDEYIVVLPLDDQFSIEAFKEVFKNTKIECSYSEQEYILINKNTPEPNVSISGGFVITYMDKSIDDMIVLADSNMYRAKFEEHNGIILTDETLPNNH